MSIEYDFRPRGPNWNVRSGIRWRPLVMLRHSLMHGQLCFMNKCISSDLLAHTPRPVPRGFENKDHKPFEFNMTSEGVQNQNVSLNKTVERSLTT